MFLVNRANILARFVQKRAIFWFIFGKMLHLGQKRQKWPIFRSLHYCVKDQLLNVTVIWDHIKLWPKTIRWMFKTTFKI